MVPELYTVTISTIYRTMWNEDRLECWTHTEREREREREKDRVILTVDLITESIEMTGTAAAAAAAVICQVLGRLVKHICSALSYHVSHWFQAVQLLHQHLTLTLQFLHLAVFLDRSANTAASSTPRPLNRPILPQSVYIVNTSRVCYPAVGNGFFRLLYHQ